MGDSEDEYDRKRRDKFRGERTESYQRGEGRRGPAEEGRRREEWVERDFQRGNRNQPRGDYRDYRGGGVARERYSPVRTHDIAPPIKRMRTDWGDDRRSVAYAHDTGYSEASYGGAWHGGGGYGQHSSYGASNQVSRGGAVEALETQPPMMSFKSYLITQDDNITDDEAIKKYNEYKLEFKRQQLNEFFITHKDEEWFKTKYHPEEAAKRKAEQTNALLNRVKVYHEFTDTGRIDKVSVDADKSDDLMKLLDAVVVRLEGGTDFDLQALDETLPTKLEGTSSKQSHAARERSPEAKRADGKGESQADEPKRKPFVSGGDNEEPGSTLPADSEAAKDSPEPTALDVSEEQDEMQTKQPEATKQLSAGDDELVPAKQEPEKKRKRSYSESGSDSGDEPDTPGVVMETDEPPPPGLDEEAELPEVASPQKEEEGTAERGEVEEKSDSKLNNGAEDISDKEDNDKGSIPEEGEEGAEGDGDKSKELSRGSTPEVSRPRLLHRTASIFLRNLAPTITKQEVETMCRRYPGFLRVAIADPQPERRWFRRGWVTFERNVNIKEVCWNLNNIRLRDCELGAIVNRDLSRRIRTVNGLTVHKQVVRNDIKLSARIVHNLDSRAGLWDDAKGNEEEKKEEQKKKAVSAKHEDLPSFNLSSKNPVLKNITDYLIEEASAEEDELLGLAPDSEEGQIEDCTVIFRDENLIRVLDRLLLYLRVVHSVDYYNHCEYPNEDEMPNRCGIMHARGIPPSLKQLSHDEISDYCRTFESKIASFLQPVAKLPDDEYNKLGHKDPDSEVEKFVKANTQELAKDKWLCPLSGKKFKGPDFVRKHIFNKHTEKVDEVRKEVEYFNNYLRDPKRPQLLEHPGNRQRKDAVSDREGGYTAPAQPYMQSQYGSNPYGGYGGGRTGYGGGHGYGGGYQGYTQGYSRPRGGGFNRGRGGGSSEFRPVIHYRDLDAPREPEEFI